MEIPHGEHLFYISMVKSWVRYSGFVWFITIAVTCLFVCMTVGQAGKGNIVTAILFGAGLSILFVAALLYGPLWVGVEDGTLMVRRPLRMLRIPVSDIADIRLHKPTMGEKRLLGSGGWFGYWGWFMEADTGRYFAYYGRASDCFMVTLKDGRKYLLGCKDPEKIIDKISN